MRLFSCLVAMVTLAESGKSADFESRFFVETEKAYFFEAAQANGPRPFYLPKKDIRLTETGTDQGRVVIDAELFFQQVSDADVSAVQATIPEWKELPVNPLYTFVAANCGFTREKLNQIEATGPQPKRKGTWTSNYVDRFCGFQVKILDAQTNREILAKAAAGQTLITSGIEKHRVILKNAKITAEIDAVAVYRTLSEGFAGEPVNVSKSRALFLALAAIAKNHSPEMINALGQAGNDEAIEQLMSMIFVAQSGEYTLRNAAPTEKNPIVTMIGTKTIELDI